MVWLNVIRMHGTYRFVITNIISWPKAWHWKQLCHIHGIIPLLSIQLIGNIIGMEAISWVNATKSEVMNLLYVITNALWLSCVSIWITNWTDITVLTWIIIWTGPEMIAMMIWTKVSNHQTMQLPNISSDWPTASRFLMGKCRMYSLPKIMWITRISGRPTSPPWRDRTKCKVLLPKITLDMVPDCAICSSTH